MTSGSHRPLDFVVIGAHKSASTAVAGGLAQHPAVWMPQEEIPAFRDPVFERDGTRALDAYLAAHTTEERVGVKCPDYLARHESIQRVRAHSPEAKLIAVLRDPAARALSNWFWHVRWGLLPVEDADTGITKVLDGTYRTRNGNVDEIIDWGLYARHLRVWLEEYRRDELMVHLNETIRTAPGPAFREMFEFLGVSADFEPVLGARAATNEGVYAPARLRFVNLRNRYVLHWNEDRTYAELSKATGPVSSVFSGAVGGIDRYVLARVFDNRRPELRPDVMERLRQRFDTDIADLEALFDLDLTAWKSEAARAADPRRPTTSGG